MPTPAEHQSIPLDDLAWIRDYISTHRWRTAKSGPPHSYTVREWEPEDDAIFVKMVTLIRKYGVPEKFYSKTHVYLHIDGLKYWTMGAPLWETIIINRANADEYYGRQDAPMWKAEIRQDTYDGLAAIYDDRYSTSDYLAEDESLTKILAPMVQGSVLDIGCGTGHALRLFRINPKTYLGLDPSRAMLNEMIRSYPEYPVEHNGWETYVATRYFDTIIALYGTASYIHPSEWSRLENAGKNYALMFYKEGYAPSYYGEDPPHFHPPQDHPYTLEFSNYIIASNVPLERNDSA